MTGSPGEAAWAGTVPSDVVRRYVHPATAGAGNLLRRPRSRLRSMILAWTEPISDKASVARQSRRLRASARKQVPRIAPVELHRPGRPVWICNVLMDNGRGAPAVEATTSNMQWLVDLVSSDITSGVSPRPAYGAPSGAKRRPRLLADGSREYFVRGSWIKKKKVAGKFRTMKRRPSDEEVPPRRRRVVRHAPAQLAVASDVDPLDMPL